MFVMMFTQLLLWCLWGGALLGIALQVQQMRKADTFSFGNNLFCSFWIGIALLILFLQLWHFFLPINFSLWIIVIILGYFFFYRNWRLFYTHREEAKWFLLIFLILGMYLTNRSLSKNLTFDTGLYHWQVIKWSEQFAIIPGLGNLKPHLAFNNSSLLLATLWNQTPWGETAVRSFTGFFILVTATFALYSFGKYIVKKDNEAIFFATTLPFLYFCGAYSIGLSTDLFFSLLFLPAGFLFYQLLTQSVDKKTITSLVILLLCLPTIKISTLIIAVLMLTVLGWITLRKRNEAFIHFCKMTLLFGCLFLGCWMGRNIILSGYPLFPLDKISFPVDWKVPLEIVQEEVWGIESFAKNPLVHRNLVSGWNWFTPWIKHSLLGREGILLILLPLSVIMGMNVFSRIGTIRWYLLCPLLGALIYWFVMAPAPRFLGSILWVFAALFVMLGVEGIHRGRRWFILTMIVYTFAFYAFGIWKKPDSFYTSNKEFASYQSIPYVKSKVEKNIHGVSLHLTLAEGDMRAQVWDLPILSAYGSQNDLQLRDPHDLAKGFRK